MQVFIFSYNRGKFLKNAVHSVLHHVDGGRITIIDDFSDEPESINILEELSQSVEVINPPLSTAFEHKTGGLHNAMNFAVQLAEARGEEIVLMLQDDMQIVRPVGQSELAVAREFFERTDGSFVLSTNFFKAKSAHKKKGLIRYGGYYLEPDMRISYGDTGFFHIQKLRSTIGSLVTGERENQKITRLLGLKQGMMVLPFSYYLPFPITYRGRQRSILTRFLDHISGAGIHPIEGLKGDRLNDFLVRDPNLLPIAEIYLRSLTAPRSKYWSLHGGRYNFAARFGLRLPSKRQKFPMAILDPMRTLDDFENQGDFRQNRNR